MRMGSVGPSLVTPSERPLSREEFMQLQDHERRRRLMQEQQDRYLMFLIITFVVLSC